MFFGVYGVYGMLRCGFPHIKMTHLWRIYEHTAAQRDRRAASALVVPCRVALQGDREIRLAAAWVAAVAAGA